MLVRLQSLRGHHLLKVVAQLVVQILGDVVQHIHQRSLRFLVQLGCFMLVEMVQVWCSANQANHAALLRVFRVHIIRLFLVILDVLNLAIVVHHLLSLLHRASLRHLVTTGTTTATAVAPLLDSQRGAVLLATKRLNLRVVHVDHLFLLLNMRFQLSHQSLKVNLAFRLNRLHFHHACSHRKLERRFRGFRVVHRRRQCKQHRQIGFRVDERVQHTTQTDAHRLCDLAFGAQLAEDHLQLRQASVDGTRLQSSTQQHLRTHRRTKLGRKRSLTFGTGAIHHNKVRHLRLVRASLLMNGRDKRHMSSRRLWILSRRCEMRRRVRINDLVVGVLRVGNVHTARLVHIEPGVALLERPVRHLVVGVVQVEQEDLGHVMSKRLHRRQLHLLHLLLLHHVLQHSRQHTDNAQLWLAQHTVRFSRARLSVRNQHRVEAFEHIRYHRQGNSLEALLVGRLGLEHALEIVRVDHFARFVLHRTTHNFQRHFLRLPWHQTTNSRKNLQ
mmetsp:Transcript_26625/g.43583  ORF Transcript_26625/g.43583 Transcript_26625/m.43583 type:complete len:499 (-) Transcript_26625:162-1658(-)